MSRLPLVTLDEADAEQAPLLGEVQRQLSRVPNLYAAMANSPATLRGYLELREALTKGKLSSRLREQLALLVAHENDCDYCVAAHTMRATRMGFSADAIEATTEARADDPHAAAILSLARDMLRKRGRITDRAVAQARAQGVSDAELGEIVGHIALNVLSNYFNHLGRPELDFPPVRSSGAPEMTSDWRRARSIELKNGYSVLDREGLPVGAVHGVRFSIEGGFLHIQVDAATDIQAVSAPAVARIVYGPDTEV